ncbi:MAG: DNA-binding protein [Crocinitomicaceae bacterium]|nr:DNA-binding protein [Crocinitomicaceae bacterium]
MDNIKSEGLSRNNEVFFEQIVRAGKRTYFFDVKATRSNDYYLTMTESIKRFKDDGTYTFQKHKIFLYKEDFDEFEAALKNCLNKIQELQLDN